jgi:hypothetical protein
MQHHEARAEARLLALHPLYDIQQVPDRPRQAIELRYDQGVALPDGLQGSMKWNAGTRDI